MEADVLPPFLASAWPVIGFDFGLRRRFTDVTHDREWQPRRDADRLELVKSQNGCTSWLRGDLVEVELKICLLVAHVRVGF